jgi:pyruvate/2-oxoacid:ferredoxin oxidoreductase alpha subunit
LDPTVVPDMAPGSPSYRGLETELRYQIEEAQERAKTVITEVNTDFTKKFGRSYGNGLIEEYRTEDAKGVLITMGSMTGTARVVVDQMREEGKPIGLVKLRSFRPFPTEDLRGHRNVSSSLSPRRATTPARVRCWYRREGRDLRRL